MRKESHKYDITQCALYKKKSSKQLKKVLCITEEEYKDILSIVLESQKFFVIKAQNSPIVKYGFLPICFYFRQSLQFYHHPAASEVLELIAVSRFLHICSKTQKIVASDSASHLPLTAFFSLGSFDSAAWQ